jgi:ferritin-like metal-binding protein YciE
MTIQSPTELLLDQIRDLYSVESQVLLTLPELAAIAPQESLRNLFLQFERLTTTHKERLKQCCELLDSTPEGDISKAMQGLIEGGNEHIRMAEGDVVKGLILIAHVNRILHYEIAGYGFATALAGHIGNTQVEELLHTSLREDNASACTLADAAGGLFNDATDDAGAT